MASIMSSMSQGTSNHLVQDAGSAALDRHAVRLAVFDVGGVIVRHCRSWEDGLRAAGFDVPPPQPSEADLAARMRAGMALMCGLMSAREFRQTIAATTAGTLTADDVARVHEAWLGDPYEGVVDLLIELAERPNIEIALLSNIDELHWARLMGGVLAPLSPRVHHRFPSFELGLAKPMPGIYRHVQDATGHAGAQVLFFDDAPENIAAAAALGWSAELIDWRSETRPQLARTLGALGLL